MSILRALVFAASVAVSQCRQNERLAQPHIIFMLVDDLGARRALMLHRRSRLIICF